MTYIKVHLANIHNFAPAAGEGIHITVKFTANFSLGKSSSHEKALTPLVASIRGTTVPCSMLPHHLEGKPKYEDEYEFQCTIT